MCDEILKECLDAKARLVHLFGDLETYMECHDEETGKTYKARRKIRGFTDSSE